jgi:hypothetical protein
MAQGEIEFCMTLSDEKEFAEFLFSNFNAAIIRDVRYETKELEIYYDVESFLKQPPWVEYTTCNSWCIWFRDLGNFDIVYIDLEGKRLYSIWHNENPIITFKRCFIEEDILRFGYFAYLNRPCVPPRLSEDQAQRLTKMFEKLRRWVKKHGENATWDGERKVYNSYILPGAKKAFLDGTFLGSQGMQYVPPGCTPHEYEKIPWPEVVLRRRRKEKEEKLKKNNQM